LLRFALRRSAQGIAVALGVTLAVFLLLRLVGDPVRRLLPIGFTQAQYDALATRLGLDQPLLVQLGDYFSGLLRFDLGESIWLNAPVTQILGERLPNTLSLIGAGIGVALIVSSMLGTVAAANAGSWIDRVITAATLTLLSLPWFWTGGILILLLAVQLGLFPTSGATEGLRSLALPAIALALPIIGRLTQVVRQSVLGELAEPYVATARSKGFSVPYILSRHVPRNALLPVTSFVGWEIIRSLGASTVVVEVVFSYPGIGSLAVDAARRQDIVLLQSTVLLVALLIVLTYFVFDLLYSLIDPRVRESVR